jgi:hypothetical protein
MADQLIPCSACLRHVRRAEVACPFCGAAVSTAPQPPREPFRRLAAAAAVAAGVAALTGCSDSSSGSGSGTGFYGSPGVLEDSGEDSGNPSGGDGSAVAFYGGPQIDAGSIILDTGTDSTGDGPSGDAADTGTGAAPDAAGDGPQTG